MSDVAAHDDLPLLEQAALWHDRRASGVLSETDLRRFESWRQENPKHAAAYAEIEAAHATAQAFAGSNEMLALRQEMLASLVVRRSRRPWYWTAAASVAALLIVAIGTVLLLRSPAEPAPTIAQRAPDLYQTAVGERLAATLPDGSRLVLNTDSRLRVAYDGQERRLVLERGQALFEVAHGERRPFVVLAGGQRITATGTTFDVRLGQNNRVQVALVEGRVLVRADRPQAQATTLQPNDVLVASSTIARVEREPEVEHLVSWRNGQLIFENENLTEAVAEINRYVRRPIILEGDAIGRIRVSGAFRTGETGAFIEALELSFPIRVVARRPDAIVLAAAN